MPVEISDSNRPPRSLSPGSLPPARCTRCDSVLRLQMSVSGPQTKDNRRPYVLPGVGIHVPFRRTGDSSKSGAPRGLCADRDGGGWSPGETRSPASKARMFSDPMRRAISSKSEATSRGARDQTWPQPEASRTVLVARRNRQPAPQTVAQREQLSKGIKALPPIGTRRPGVAKSLFPR